MKTLRPSQSEVDRYLVEYQSKMGAWKYAGHTMDELVSIFQPDEGPESKLQGKITFWAKDHGFPCLSFRQSRNAKGFISPGWPDITLIMKGKILFLELKSAKGYLKKEQKDMALRFFHLGHVIHKVKSYRQFMELVSNYE